MLAVLLVAPPPDSVEEIAVVVLSFCPSEVAVTVTAGWHMLFAFNVPPLREMTLLLTANVPPQALTLESGAVRPAGNVSLNAMPCRVLVLELLIVNVRLVVPFNGIVAPPKAFDIVGATMSVLPL